MSRVESGRLRACNGFSLLELLTSIVILAFLVTIAAKSMGKFDKDVKIVAALKDMKAMQIAIVKGVYPDLGFIPCGIDKNASEERKMLEALFIPSYLFLERSAIIESLNDSTCLKEGYINVWEKYKSRGWQGPYMKGANGTLNATYFDKRFSTTEQKNFYLPAMLSPWAEICEEKALEAEQKGETDLAYEYRKGKYYQIFYPQITLTGPEFRYNTKGRLEPVGWLEPVCELSGNRIFIVCRGADCLPPPPSEPDYPYVDVADCLKCEALIRENALAGCKVNEKTIQGLRTCIKEKYENEYPGCYDGNPMPLEMRLATTDSRNENYMDITDDLVMSVFGRLVRSPLD